MANHKSAEKRHRQSLTRRNRNRMVKASVRTATKKVADALEGGDIESAKTTLRDAEKALSKAATKGVLKKKTVSRQVSRLAKKVAVKTK